MINGEAILGLFILGVVILILFLINIWLITRRGENPYLNNKPSRSMKAIANQVERRINKETAKKKKKELKEKLKTGKY